MAIVCLLTQHRHALQMLGIRQCPLSITVLPKRWETMPTVGELHFISGGMVSLSWYHQCGTISYTALKGFFKISIGWRQKQTSEQSFWIHGKSHGIYVQKLARVFLSYWSILFTDWISHDSSPHTYVKLTCCKGDTWLDLTRPAGGDAAVVI